MPPTAPQDNLVVIKRLLKDEMQGARVIWKYESDDLKDRFEAFSQSARGYYQARQHSSEVLDSVVEILEVIAEELGLNLFERWEEFKEHLIDMILPDILPDFPYTELLEQIGTVIETGGATVKGFKKIRKQAKTAKRNMSFGLQARKIKKEMKNNNPRTWTASGSAMVNAIINHGHLIMAHDTIDAMVAGGNAGFKLFSLVSPASEATDRLVGAAATLNTKLNSVLFKLAIGVWTFQQKKIIEEALKTGSISRMDMERCPYLACYMIVEFPERFGIMPSTHAGIFDHLDRIMQKSLIKIVPSGRVDVPSTSSRIRITLRSDPLVNPVFAAQEEEENAWIETENPLFGT